MTCDISIIVPAYNSEKTINRCIESVLKQTYPKWELIIVNDGSNDSTVEKLARYSNDSRIMVFNTKNSGVSSARNMGLQRASGLYVLFLDSDDELLPNCCEVLLAHISNSDLVIGSYLSYNETNGKVETYQADSFIGPTRFFLYNYRQYYNKRLIQGPCCKLYKKLIIDKHSISFPTDLSYGEDTFFVYEYLKYTSSITFDDIVISRIHIYQNSLCHGFRSDKLSIQLNLNLKLFDLFTMYCVYPHDYCLEQLNCEAFVAYLNDCVRYLNNKDALFELQKTILKYEVIDSFKKYNPSSIKYRLIRYLIVNKKIKILFCLAKINLLLHT